VIGARKPLGHKIADQLKAVLKVAVFWVADGGSPSCSRRLTVFQFAHVSNWSTTRH
jgi:hypothetical protein